METGRDPDSPRLPAQRALRLAELLRRIQRRWRRSVLAELGPSGLTPARWRALRILGEGSLRIGELARRLDIVPRSATGLVDELEQRGWAARQADPEDRRAWQVRLTGDGRRLLRRLERSRQAGLTVALEHLSADDQEELLRLLELVDAGSGGASTARPDPRSQHGRSP